MFSVALIADRNRDDAGAPVAHEAFCSSIEDWLRRHSFGTSAINELVVEVDCAV